MSEYMQGGAIAEDDFDFSATRERARTVGRASAAAKSPALNVAIGVSAAVVVVGVVLWAMQLSGGMVQTAMRNLDSWGLYITGFMFFVGLSAGGLIISSVPKAFGIAGFGGISKVAVFSREANLDPVGACVGPKGSRVRMVVEELRNERVDVIQWSPDPAVYVANALSPAKVSHVSIDEDNNYATVIVPDDQLSLAIGKEGQNARLAARLTGWHIDIKPQSFQGASLVDVEMDDEVEEDDGFCIFVDEDGNRCRNHARPNSQYCGVHADAEAEA